MRLEPTTIPGVVIVELEPQLDERGSFARLWCRHKLEDAGLNGDFVQTNVATNPHRHTLRGLHFQSEPYGEAKLVWCPRGALFDVAVDLRSNSPTYGEWFGIELAAGTGRQLYIPEGCAHGYLTLVDHTELAYGTTRLYEPDAATGVRYDDPMLGIDWPHAPRIIGERDRSWPLLGARESAA